MFNQSYDDMWVISLSTGFVQVLENQENSGILFLH